MPAVVFPDAEAWAVEYLDEALKNRPEPYAQGVYISTRKPNTRRDRMVLVRRDGGPRLDLVRDLARLTIRVFGSDEKEAHDLAALVRALLGVAAEVDDAVLDVHEQSGPLPVEDDLDGTTFRLLVVEVTFVGRSLA